MSADIRTTSTSTASIAPLQDAAGTSRLVPLASLRTSYARLRPGALPARAAAGVDLPIRVILTSDGNYEVLDGFKRIDRWRRQGHSSVPVVVETPASPVEHKRLLLSANAPPRTITPLDEARVVASMAKDDKLSRKAIGKLLGHGPDWVDCRLKFDSRLGPIAQQKLSTGDIGPSLACALTALGVKDQEAVLGAAEKHELSARECVRLVATYRTANDQDRRQLLTDPLSIARPELSRQATLSSRAVAIEQTLTGFRHSLKELAAFVLPDDLAPPEHRRLEALWRCVLDELHATAAVLRVDKPASSSARVPDPQSSANRESSTHKKPEIDNQEILDEDIYASKRGRSRQVPEQSPNREPSDPSNRDESSDCAATSGPGGPVATSGPSDCAATSGPSDSAASDPVTADATQATARQTAQGDLGGRTGRGRPTQTLLRAEEHSRPGGSQSISGKPGPAGGWPRDSFESTCTGRQQARPVS